MEHLSIDLETFSDIDITKAGLYRYVQSPAFEILLFAYSIDFGPVKVISLAEGEQIPSEIIQALNDDNIIKHAYNAPFEIAALNRCVFFTPTYQWRCTMVHGLYCGFPAGLAKIGNAMGIREDKKKLSTGSALIKLFCTPTKPTNKNNHRTRTYYYHEIEKWKRFKEYNAQDVVSEMEILKKLSTFPMPDEEQSAWILDRVINGTGVLIDTEMMSKSIEIGLRHQEALMEEAKALTGLDNPGSVAQLKGWLTDETGEEITSLSKENVEILKSTVSNENVSRLLELRTEMGKTSLKKYEAMQNCICEDNRVRGLFQFYGTHTGRFAGRLVQVQNLPRNYIDTLDFARGLVKQNSINGLKIMYESISDTLSQLIRTAFIPDKNHKFIIADFSAIEARVIAWLADEKWVMDVFASHGKIYEATASQMFGVPIETIVKGHENYHYRAQGKVAQLSCGYQGSVGAISRMDAKNEIPDDLKATLVKRWRAANPRIVDLWYLYENAALTAVKGQVVYLPHGVIFAREVSNDLDFLTITLPSGRKLFYDRPHLVINNFGKEAVAYMGVADTQKSNSWARIDMYGGRWVENVVQAIARDCLIISMKRLYQEKFKIVMHIHDEVVIEEPINGRHLEDVTNIMGMPINWAPGLLLKADGFESEYYKKD